jgi:hypothetical protein
MDRDVKVARALSARIARRIVRIAGWVAGGALLLTLLLIWALAYFFSGWWWLLLVPWGVAAVISLGVRIIAGFVVRGLYREPLNRQQRQGLDEMTEKIQRLIEAKATPPIVFVLVSVKDLLVHRDVTTIKELVRDTASLRADYSKLRQLF